MKERKPQEEKDNKKEAREEARRKKQEQKAARKETQRQKREQKAALKAEKKAAAGKKTEKGAAASGKKTRKKASASGKKSGRAGTDIGASAGKSKFRPGRKGGRTSDGIGKASGSRTAASPLSRATAMFDAGLMSAASDTYTYPSDSFAAEYDDNFGAAIRSSEPILKVGDTGEKGSWKRDLVLNISCAALIMAVLSLFFVSIYEPETMVWAIPCPVIFLGLTTVESVKPGKIKWIAAAVIAVLLGVTLAIWHTNILGGLGMLVNQFYDVCEEAQAYLYTRFEIGYSATETDAHAGIAWAACAIGLLAALPPARARRSVAVLISLAAMLAYAYYGLVPSWICIGIMLAALLPAVSKGSILSMLPVMLAALLVFGAVVLIDPGENYGISRMDENFRDRFAFNSALIESTYSDYYDDMSEYYDEEDEEDWEDEDYEDDSESILDGEYATYFIGGIIAVVVLLLGAVIFFVWRSIARRRAAVRAGLDSSDPREAVVAMFPYSVRWLIGCGIEPENPLFTSMIPAIQREFPEAYTRRFSEMYSVWSEAAYSDHEVTEGMQNEMKLFMKDTIDLAKKKCSFRDRLRIRLKYAL